MIQKVYEMVYDDSECPTVEQFALDQGVNVDTVYEWAKVYPPFSDALKNLKESQKNYLFKKGLHNKVNTPMAIFALKALHGWQDRVYIKTDQNIDLSSRINVVHYEDSKKPMKKKLVPEAPFKTLSTEPAKANRI